MALRQEYKTILDNAIKAINERTYYAQYPESPKSYPEEALAKGLEYFQKSLNQPFNELLQTGSTGSTGEEVSPYTMQPLGIKYPTSSVDMLITNSRKAFALWKRVSVADRADVLVDSLERIKNRFFDIAYATQHTTGQSFIMSFQASGPHSNDRALEALALGYAELTRFPDHVKWEKPMGKINVVLDKTYKPIAKGVGLVIGCSTFPVWNTVPGVYADLITGNSVIVKPHPKSVFPIAIVVAEIQKALHQQGYDPNTIQLAADSTEKLITKELAEHPEVKLIDYTGSSLFGNYIESLPNKTVFTEKAGVNSVILDSTKNLDDTLNNLAFSVSLYSGQMCTAPQNFFIPAGGVKSGDSIVSYEEVVAKFKEAVSNLVNNPKSGPGTLGAIQNELTLQRVRSATSLGAKVILEPSTVQNPEFASARVCTPTILEVDAGQMDIYEKELFGPIVLIIKTKDTQESVKLAHDLAAKHGAITCAAYTTDEQLAQYIIETMEEVFTPVTLNLSGPIWVNQHAAFSDFHVTGGNPAGNASFSNPEFINKRFVWVGHRKNI
jgi:phenylacetic acid degradation protein paaN